MKGLMKMISLMTLIFIMASCVAPPPHPHRGVPPGHRKHMHKKWHRHPGPPRGPHHPGPHRHR